MTDPRDPLARLVSDAVSDIEPHDRLDQIRASVRSDQKVVPMARTRSPWLNVASGVVATAAVIGVIAYVTGALPGSENANGPDPANPGPGHSRHTATPTPGASSAYAVYYVGTNPLGKPVLFREFRAGVAATGSDAAQQSLDGLTSAPLDPDYSTGWQAGTFSGATLNGDVIDVALAGPSVHDRPAGLSAAQTEASVQQVIYTVQAAFQTRAPVQFTLHGNPVDQVLGVPTSEPLAQGKPLKTLSLMSISSPNEGQQVSGQLTVTGVNNGFEASLSVRLEHNGKQYLVTPGMSAGWMGEHLYPWTVTLDLTQVPPGQYTLVAMNDDPSGAGKAETDTRTIIVK